MGKDIRGINRGKCSKRGCDCVQYFKEENGQKCTNCGHVPTVHTKIDENVWNLSSLASEESDDIKSYGRFRGGSDEEVSENDSVPLRHQLSESNIGSNTDIRGNLRGGCNECNCKQYSYIKERGSKCSVCGHVPAQHTQLTQLLTAVPHEQEELEKDTPLFTKSRNAIPSNASSSLCITDVEEEEKTPPVPKLKPQPVKRKTHFLNLVSLINKHHPSSVSLPAAGQMDRSPHMPPGTCSFGHGLYKIVFIYFVVIRPRDDYVSQQQQPSITMSPIAPAAANVNPQPSVQQPSIQQTCKLDGCNKPVHVEQSGKVHEFCCHKHALDFKSNGE